MDGGEAPIQGRQPAAVRPGQAGKVDVGDLAGPDGRTQIDNVIAKVIGPEASHQNRTNAPSVIGQVAKGAERPNDHRSTNTTVPARPKSRRMRSETTSLRVVPRSLAMLRAASCTSGGRSIVVREGSLQRRRSEPTVGRRLPAHHPVTSSLIEALSAFALLLRWHDRVRDVPVATLEVVAPAARSGTFVVPTLQSRSC